MALTTGPSHSLLVVAVLSLAAAVHADASWTLASMPSYSIQRLCVKECLQEGQPGGGPPLPAALQCPQPYMDSCVCATDLTASASSFLTSCAAKFCSANTVDIAAALSLYDGFCAGDLPAVTSIPSVTIQSASQYSVLRTCVQDCLWDGTPGGGNPVGNQIGCDNPLYSACFCRADLTSVAISYLTSCINSLCSADTKDINAGVSVYLGYCTGFAPSTTSAATTQTTQKASPGSTPASVTPSASTIRTPTATPTAGSSPNAATIGGAVGGSVVGILLVAIGGFCFCRSRTKQKPETPIEKADEVREEKKTSELAAKEVAPKESGLIVNERPGGSGGQKPAGAAAMARLAEMAAPVGAELHEGAAQTSELAATVDRPAELAAP